MLSVQCCCSLTASTAEGIPARLQRKLAADLAACPRLKVAGLQLSIDIASALLVWSGQVTVSTYKPLQLAP
jgi:hypothetical protein